MTKTQIKQGIGLIIFGLVIPVALFLNAFPGGPRELFNKVMYMPDLIVEGQTYTVSLGPVFTIEDISYVNAVNVLQSATSEDRVVIVVRENFGGNAAILDELSKAMGKSKAKVLVRLEHFGLSCGTYVLGDSDYTFIPNDSLLLFHFGTFDGIKIQMNSADPMIRDAAKEVDAFFQAYRDWVTDSEYQKIRNGADIFLTGKDICSKTDGRNAPVLYQTSDGCVVKGMRKQ